MRFLRGILAVSTVLLFALAGCSKDEEIIRSEVEHPDREPIRLRIGILEKGVNAWIFRMSGPVKLIEEHGPTFEAFVKSVRFEADKKEPTWTDPKGWKKDLPTKNRIAGFRIDSKPKELEIAVTRFEDFKLMDNMHRWQKQVNVPLTETHEQLEQQVKREKVGDLELIWVDLKDGYGVHTVSKPPEPMAQNKKNFLPGIPMKKPAAQVGAGGGGGDIPFKYTAPAGWVKKPPRQFILDAYEISDGKTSGELTLSTLGGSTGGNINRWRDQVMLAKVSDAEALRKADEQTIAGLKAYVVDLANRDGPPGKNRILGAVIPMGQQSFFIKFTGPLDLLEARKGEFDAFLKSFKQQ